MDMCGKEDTNGRKIVPSREVEHRVNREQQLVEPSSAQPEMQFYDIACTRDDHALHTMRWDLAANQKVDTVPVGILSRLLREGESR